MVAFEPYQLFLIPLVFTAICSYLLTPLAISLAKRFGMVDDPTVNKHAKVTHAYPVPRAGGIPIYLSLLISCLVFLPIEKHLLGILAGASVIVIVGLLDDRWNLSPYLRLFGGNLLSAVLVVSAGIGIAYLTNPFQSGVIDLSHPRFFFEFFSNTHSLWLLTDIFAVTWIIGMMNIVGIGAGGVEGQFPGVIAIAAITIAILSLRFSADITQWPVIILAAITAGAYLGFLPWNFYPQKIMPGYSGKSLGGFLLAVLAILSTTKVGTALVVLGVPLMDFGWAVIRRLLHKKSPVWGDRGHLHHKLLDQGWSKPRVAIFYWLITGLLGGMALQLNSQQKLYTIISVGIIVGAVLLWSAFWLTSSKQSAPDNG